MKFTPLKRKTTLRRSRRLRSHRRPRSLTTPEDKARLDWLHEQRCCAPGHENCPGPVEVHHDTQDRAKGKKSSHERGMPMCHESHVFGLHANAGPFKGWKKEQLREWQTGQVMRWQARWLAHIERWARDTIDREGNVTR
jgi:hypothetical protein